MKKFFYFSFVIGYILSGICQAQIQFQCAIGVGSSIGDFCFSIVQTVDGGYALGGYSNNAGYADMYIVKFDGSGELQWTRTVHKSSTYNACRSIVQTTDSGYVAVAVGNGDFYVEKLSGGSALQWTTTVGGSGSDQQGYSIIQTTDGGYAVAGRTNVFGAGGYDVYIVKLDGNGVLQWTRTVGGSGLDWGYSIVQTGDGGYVVAGQTDSFGAGGDDVYIVKLDSNGALQWTRTVGGSGTDQGYSIIQTTGGGYCVAGQTNSFGSGGDDFYIVKLDSNGALQWTRTVGGSGSEQGYSIVQTIEGGFAVVGNTGSFGGDSYMVKLDGSGALQWTRIFGGSGNDQSHSIVQSIDGGYAVGGYTSSYGAGGADFYIAKFDSNGNTCGTTSSGGTAGSGGISGSGGTSGSGGIAIVPQGMVSGTLGTLTNICSVVPVELTSFTALINGKEVILNWLTATETNNQGFEVERQAGSGDLREDSWEEIGFVPGYGTTTEPKSYSFSDDEVTAGKYSYRLKQIDYDGRFEYSKVTEVLIISPLNFELSQNYPNPFNPTTTISYSIKSAGLVNLKVYDMLGIEVASLVNEREEPGNYSVVFNAANLPSGIYFYTLTSGNFTATKKLILLK